METSGNTSNETKTGSEILAKKSQKLTVFSKDELESLSIAQKLMKLLIKLAMTIIQNFQLSKKLDLIDLLR